MNRNIEKAIQAGDMLTDKRPQLSLTQENMNYFYEAFKRDETARGTAAAVFNLIYEVYHAGLAVGNRNK